MRFSASLDWGVVARNVTTALVGPPTRTTPTDWRFCRRGSLLNQYQGGMCISGRLTMTERTPRHLISPLGPNWVGTDSAV